MREPTWERSSRRSSCRGSPSASVGDGHFLITGALGFFWFLLWMAIYRKPEEHPQCSAEELEYIRSDGEKPTAPLPWVRLFGYRQTWAFLLAKFLTDPIWWFYLFWVPGFFQEQHGLNLTQIGLPVVVIYLISDAGSVAGGGCLRGLFSWHIGEYGAQGGDANLRAVRGSDYLCVSRARVVVDHAVDRASRRGAPGIFRQFVYDSFGFVSEPRSGVGSRNWWRAGAVGGMLIASIVGQYSAGDRELLRSLSNGGRGLFDCVGGDA